MRYPCYITQKVHNMPESGFRSDERIMSIIIVLELITEVSIDFRPSAQEDFA